MNNISRRKHWLELFSLLQESDFDRSMEAIRRHVPRRLVGPLISFFYNGEAHIRWRAITVMGLVVAQMADQDMESARVVMRRLIWNLNDESGGIGWGSPEAMGEIMAHNHQLADEYGRLLESYIREDGNYLNHPDLQAGVLWGIGRLAHARPHIVAGTAPLLKPFLQDGTPILKGLASWASQAIFHESLRQALKCLETDATTLCLYRERTFTETTIGQLASTALERHPLITKLNFVVKQRIEGETTNEQKNTSLCIMD